MTRFFDLFEQPTLVLRPVVTFNGQKFTGPSHTAACEAALRQGVESEIFDAPRCFELSNGQIVDRRKALEIALATGQVSPKYSSRQEMHSEMMDFSHIQPELLP